MKYPKPVMHKTELLDMGFTRTYLDRAIAAPGQTFAWPINPANKSSPVLFDTEGFERWRLKEVAMRERARREQRGVM